MPVYLIKLFDEDGMVQDERTVECEDDDEAIEVAGQLDHRHEMQVWCDDRLVGRFRSLNEGDLGFWRSPKGSDSTRS